MGNGLTEAARDGVLVAADEVIWAPRELVGTGADGCCCY
jgi:hypothetical protein